MSKHKHQDGRSLRAKLPWCVQYVTDRKRKQTGWCATFRGHRPSPNADMDLTACDHQVTFRIGSERRMPTCKECLARVQRRRRK